MSPRRIHTEADNAAFDSGWCSAIPSATCHRGITRLRPSLKGLEALAAQLLQLDALGVAQLVAADQAVGAVPVGGDAVAGEHPAHHALPRIRRATSCAGAGLRRPSSSRSMSGWSMWLMRICAAT